MVDLLIIRSLKKPTSVNIVVHFVRSRYIDSSPLCISSFSLIQKHKIPVTEGGVTKQGFEPTIFHTIRKLKETNWFFLYFVSIKTIHISEHICICLISSSIWNDQKQIRVIFPNFVRFLCLLLSSNHLQI